MQCQVASLWDTCEEALQHSNCGLGAMPLAAFWANRFFTILLVTITNVRQWFQYWIQSCDLQDIDILISTLPPGQVGLKFELPKTQVGQ